MRPCRAGSVSGYSASINNKGMRVKELHRGVAQELAWMVTQPVLPGGHSISRSGIVSSWLKRAVSHSIVRCFHVPSSFDCRLGSEGLSLGQTVLCASCKCGCWARSDAGRPQQSETGGSSCLPSVLHLLSLCCDVSVFSWTEEHPLSPLGPSPLSR